MRLLDWLLGREPPPKLDPLVWDRPLWGPERFSACIVVPTSVALVPRRRPYDQEADEEVPN